LIIITALHIIIVV